MPAVGTARDRCPLTVVTAWHNHLELSRDYWPAMRVARAKVLVLDDGSDPPLPNGVRTGGIGYQAANNAGLELVQTPGVLFLNNDIAATSADWLERLCENLEPGVLIGANLRDDPHASVDGVAVPYLDGWCIAGTVDDLRHLGGFDESYMEPAYYSDNDLCLRARAAGMRLREVRIGLRHKLNGTNRPDDPRVREATIANRKRYEALARALLATS